MTKPAKESLMWITELVWVIVSTSITCIITLIFWIKEKKVAFHLEQYQALLRGGATDGWQLVTRVIFVLLPTLINIIYYPYCYIGYLMMYSAPVWVAIISSVSIAWHFFVMTTPVLYYTILGTIIKDCFTANNALLSQAVTTEANDSSVIRVQKQSFALRKLYKELEDIVSLPLFCFDCQAMYLMLSVTFFLIYLFDSMSYIGINSVVILTDFFLSGVFILTGYIADSITTKVSSVSVCLAACLFAYLSLCLSVSLSMFIASINVSV